MFYFCFRMSMIVPKNNMTKSYLKISNLTLEDEALFKCEVTYLAVNRECNNVQHITLNVTGNKSFLTIPSRELKDTFEFLLLYFTFLGRDVYG